MIGNCSGWLHDEMERLTNFDGTLFVIDKTLFNAMSLVIPLSLLARLSSKAAVRTQVSPLLANTEITCKNVFYLDGF